MPNRDAISQRLHNLKAAAYNFQTTRQR
jgi:hypothetical protein